jgi:hypothetical protein
MALKEGPKTDTSKPSPAGSIVRHMKRMFRFRCSADHHTHCFGVRCSKQAPASKLSKRALSGSILAPKILYARRGDQCLGVCLYTKFIGAKAPLPMPLRSRREGRRVKTTKSPRYQRDEVSWSPWSALERRAAVRAKVPST